MDGGLVLTPAQLALLLEAIDWRRTVAPALPSRSRGAAGVGDFAAGSARHKGADAELHAKTLHIEKLRATLALMKRARFGRSSEKIDQLELLIGDLEEAAAEEQTRATTASPAPASKTGAPRPRGRQPLPAHLPRERVVHDAASVCPACGGIHLTRLGEDEQKFI